MSKKTPNSPLDVVTALMQERAKFENWLATLESKRAATPPNVYDRVRQDYQKRLAGVVEELGTHAAELEAQAEQYATRLGELGDREQAKREERAEAELRAHVGELSPDEWEVTSRESDDALAAIAAEQAVVGADLTRVHDLLGAATGATAAPAEPEPEPEPGPYADAEPESPQAAVAEAEPEPESVADVTSSPEPQAAPSGEPAPARASSATPEQASFDELAFLKSVVSPYGSQTPVKPPAAGTDSGPHFTQDPTEALTESLVSRANRPSQEREFIREDAADAAAGLVGRAEEPGERPYAANVTGNHPIVLRPSGAVEQPKTLKCGECAAMNYPTEWYCERCGAELASL